MLARGAAPFFPSPREERETRSRRKRKRRSPLETPPWRAPPPRCPPSALPCSCALPRFRCIAVGPLLLSGAPLLRLSHDSIWDPPAGPAPTLLAVKPHLAYLFWLALLLWAVQHRRWRVLAGGAGAGLALVGIALVFDPLVLGHYW